MASTSIASVLLGLAPLLATGGAGCVRRATTFVETAADSTAEVPRQPSEVRDVVVPDDDAEDEESEPVVMAPLKPLPMPHLAPDPVLFRIGAGYGALGDVDLAPCRDQGLPSGYLRMRVTFRDSGRIVRAAIESPVAPPQEALACIGEQLKMSMVPVFEGGDVTLSKSFFVN